MTVKNWKAVLQKRSRQIVVTRDGNEVKKIQLDKFLENGMVLFPKKLYHTICHELRYANVYDKFTDKLFEEVDNET